MAQVALWGLMEQFAETARRGGGGGWSADADKDDLFQKPFPLPPPVSTNGVNTCALSCMYRVICCD